MLQVSPVTLKCQGALPVRCLGLKDTTGSVKLALFDKIGTTKIIENGVVQISGVFRNSGKAQNNLLLPVSDCEVCLCCNVIFAY